MLALLNKELPHTSQNTKNTIVEAIQNFCDKKIDFDNYKNIIKNLLNDSNKLNELLSQIFLQIISEGSEINYVLENYKLDSEVSKEYIINYLGKPPKNNEVYVTVLSYANKNHFKISIEKGEFEKIFEVMIDNEIYDTIKILLQQSFLTSDEIEKYIEKIINSNNCENPIEKIKLLSCLTQKNKLSEEFLEKLLVFTYFINKPLYEHIRSSYLSELIFDETYQFNPYTDQNIWKKANSHLLNIVINTIIYKETGIKIMIALIKESSNTFSNAYEDIDKKTHIAHPIFHLLAGDNPGKYIKIKRWIIMDAEILLTADGTGKNPLITTILTTDPSQVPEIADLQKFAIKKYIEKELYNNFTRKNHSAIEPGMGLFLAYSICSNELEKNKNSDGLRKTTEGYQELLKEYIKSNKDSLQETIEGSLINKNLFTKEKRISLRELISSNDEKISKYNPSTLTIESKEIISKLFNNLFISDGKSKKLNKNADTILKEIQWYIKKKKIDLNNFFIIHDKQNKLFIDAVFSEYMCVKFGDVKSDKIAKIKDSFSELISTFLDRYDALKILQLEERGESQIFTVSCLLGESKILESFLRKLENEWNSCSDNDKRYITSIITFNAVKTLWYSNHRNSDSESAVNYSKCTVIFNDFINNKIKNNQETINLKYKDLNIQQCLEVNHNINNLKDFNSWWVNFDGEQIIVTCNTDKQHSISNTLAFYNYSVLSFTRIFEWMDSDVKSIFLNQKGQYLNAILQCNINNPSEPINGQLSALLENFYLALTDSLNNCADEKQKKEFADGTNGMWYKIPLLGNQNGKIIVEKLLQEGLITNNIIIPLHFIQYNIIINNYSGMLEWIGDNEKLASIGIFFATAHLDEKAVKTIIMNYHDVVSNFHEQRHSLAILYNYAKSDFLSTQKQTIDRIATLLIEAGYPIELIESLGTQKDIVDYAKGIIDESAKYIGKSQLTNFACNIMSGVFGNAINVVNNSAQKYFTYTTAASIYQKTYEYVHCTISNQIFNDGKLDLHGLYLPNADDSYKERLKKCSAITGLSNENFEVKTLTLQDSEYTKQTENDNNLVVIPYHNFIEREYWRWRGDSEENHVVKEIKENRGKFSEEIKKKIMEYTANAGAMLASGTFLYMNDSDFRNSVNAAACLLPQVFSGLSLLYNGGQMVVDASTNILYCICSTLIGIVKNNRTTIYGMLGLIVAGSAIYGGIELYQTYKIKKIESQSINIKSFNFADIEKLIALAKKKKNEMDDLSFERREEAFQFIKKCFLKIYNNSNVDILDNSNVFYKFLANFCINDILLVEKIEKKDSSFINNVIDIIVMCENAKHITREVKNLDFSEEVKKAIANTLHQTLKNRKLRYKAYFQEKMPNYSKICEELFKRLESKTFSREYISEYISL